jgi:predicted dehydrogenase
MGYRIGIVGAGFIGRKRAETARAHADCDVTMVYDTDGEAARVLAADCGATAAGSWQEIAAGPVDIVVVATTHDALASISTACLEGGKHVLCEKPMGRHPHEARRALRASCAADRMLKVGYNHRYHPAVQQVYEACVSGQLGPLMNIRGRYGHGGRPGYDREWRAIPERAGGGELLDQGAHLIDLAKWILDDFAEVSGYVETHFWDMEPLEDNAYGIFRTVSGQIASLHVSWTQWKNLFSFEVHGRDGYAIAEGLGGSYGPEQARIGRRRSEGGAPEEKILPFTGEDVSWALEWKDFLAGIEGRGIPYALGGEALETLEWVYRLYEAARKRRAVDVGFVPSS